MHCFDYFLGDFRRFEAASKVYDGVKFAREVVARRFRVPLVNVKSVESNSKANVKVRLFYNVEYDMRSHIVRFSVVNPKPLRP